jgi:hypothetical protein
MGNYSQQGFNIKTNGKMKILMDMLMKITLKGGGAHRRRFRQCFPPPISVDGDLQTLYLCVFNFRLRLL